ncbi:hypothetical protein HLB35_00075 [Halomonas sp. TBZ9]|uniref:Lipoprotein n=1 Tax=Vreelandella azerica TaxID=2732867 RepID=A0A7Y3TXQ5_9GAMM|nr:hypothetical protein [Halomonas azerica]NOG30559.1 hypothetical protein [Halomonas azerica]
MKFSIKNIFVFLFFGITMGLSGCSNETQELKNRIDELAEKNTSLMIENTTLKNELESISNREQDNKENLMSIYADEFRQSISEEIRTEAHYQRNVVVASSLFFLIALFSLVYFFAVRHIRNEVIHEKIKIKNDNNEREIAYQAAMSDFKKVNAEIEARSFVGRKLQDIKNEVEREIGKN